MFDHIGFTKTRAFHTAMFDHDGRHLEAVCHAEEA